MHKSQAHSGPTQEAKQSNMVTARILWLLEYYQWTTENAISENRYDSCTSNTLCLKNFTKLKNMTQYISLTHFLLNIYKDTISQD